MEILGTIFTPSKSEFFLSGDKMSKKKKLTKDEEVIQAYKGQTDNIKSDVNGSYTGVTENNEVPVQDADDL